MDEMFALMEEEQKKQELVRVLECNRHSERFGLALTEEQAQELMTCRKDTLKENRRVEFGEGILPQIIENFCDSQYIDSSTYVETLGRLQEIFYHYKNESMDELTDQELLEFMRQQFEEVCFGDLEYLESTCLERYARKIRETHADTFYKGLRDEYRLHVTDNEYQKLSEESRWDDELYRTTLEDIE